MLQVRLIGQFDVRADGKPVNIPSRAAQSLLAFLVVHRDTIHRREKLAGIFWPDTTDETARKNLRQELWRIRKALAVAPAADSYLVAEEFTLTFNRDADYWLDLAALETPQTDLDALIANLSLYQGELLPGFYDDWVVLERERVQAIFENKMAQLLELLTAAERWTAVQEWGEKWLALGDAPEPAYRALMLAYGVRGDMAKVAALYRRCTDELREQLGVEPSAETRALYEGLSKGAHVPIRTPTPQPSGTLTFLFTDIEGSTRLLDSLREQYATILADHHAILRGAIQKWHGREVDTQGDAFFVTFARALDAVQCAVEAQRALAAHTWSGGEQVRVRMGLHTGEPLVGATGYIGMDVHRAARIGEAGHGGQVLMSQATRELVLNDLPAGVSIQSLGEQRLKDMKYPTPIFQLVIEGLQNEFAPLKTKFTGTEPPTPGTPPFKGLNYFDEIDAELFFGREALTEKLLRRIHGAQFLSVVIGASGSGKSSLVRAGLVPAVRRNGGIERIFVMTPTAHPLEALATELTRDSESITATATLLDDLARDPRALHLYLRRTTEDERRMSVAHSGSPVVRHVLVVVDQFEELFTLCRDEFERVAFVDNLLYAISPDREGRVTVLITLRADFYAHVAQYPELRNAVAQHQEYIGPMTTEELRRAMEEPARRGHWEFAPGLVDLILRDVGEEPGALPLLSHALLETWKRRAGHTMTLQGYHDAGGVRGAIAHTAESVYENLAPQDQAVARDIFLRLTEPGEGTEDTRRRASLEELYDSKMGDADSGGASSGTPRESADETRRVLNRLAEARLVTLGEDTAEVAHEAVIREWGRLREWLNQDREGLRLHRQLTEAANEWELLERDAGALYRGAHLVQAWEWSSLHPNALNIQERTFLDASKEQEEREQREHEARQQREIDSAKQVAAAARQLAETQTRTSKELRRRALFLAGAFVLALVLAGIALFLNSQANQNARVAQENSLIARSQERLATSRELAASAISNLGIDPELSLLLTQQAVAVTQAIDGSVLPEAEEALHRSILASQVRLTLRGHKAWVMSTAFSPDGSRLATIDREGTIILWNSVTGTEILRLGGTTEPQDTSSGQRIAFSPDGKRIATYDNKLVHIRDAATGNILFTLAGHTEEVWALAFSPDGKHIATGSVDTTARVWDATSGRSLLTLTEHTEPIEALAYSPDGMRLATASDDGTVKVWDASTGERVLELSDFGSEVYGVAFSPDGLRLATVASDLKVWELSARSVVLTIAVAEGGMVGFSPDGTKLAATVGSQAKVWDANTGHELLTLSGHTSGINGIAFSPDGQQLASASADTTARVWDLTPSQEVMTLSGQGTKVVYSPDGTQLATDGPGGTINIWDAVTHRKVLTLAGHGDAVSGMAFSPDGKRLATTAWSTPVAKVWDLQTGQLAFDLIGHAIGVRDIGYSPDGARIATASFDQTAKVWDATTGRELLTLTGHNGLVVGVAFSPDGKRLATTSTDATLKVWNAAAGKLLYTATGHTGPIPDVAFSPDGTRIATASSDRSARIWDASTGTELLSLRGHRAEILSIAFSSDGALLATGSADNTAKVWEVATGKELHTVFGQVGGVTAVAFRPGTENSQLAVASGGLARVYLLRPEDLIALAKTRVTRTLTTEECQKYLHLSECPTEN